MSKSFLLLILAFLLSAQVGFSQTQSAWIKAADKAYDKEDFYSAYRYYAIALEYDTSRTDIWYKLGESSRKFNADSTATVAYTQVLTSEDKKNFPEAAYWLATIKQRQKKYDEAITLYNLFLNQDPPPAEELKSTAESRIESSEWAKGMLARADSLYIQNLGPKINSPYSDFGVAIIDDTLYYSSYKFLYKKDSLNPPRNFVKIMRSVNGGEGKPLKDNLDFSTRHVAHSTFNSDKTKMYFTICEYETPTKIQCDLYSSDRKPNGKWSTGERLPINAQGFTNTQPNFAVDPSTGEKFLYFVSDRDGGMGQLDIWRSQINDDDTCEPPINMGELNTAGNDVTPFYLSAIRTLYFSSDGYLSLGGYDIYESQQLINGWSEPENLGIPLNSGYNDLYYSAFNEGAKVYFSSDRPDSTAIFWDEFEDACCNDIYTADVDISVELDVLTFDDEDKTPLSGVTVELYEVTANGKNLIATLKNPESNDFNFKLQHGKKYYIEGKREGYQPATAEIDLTDPSTKELRKIEKELFLPRTNEVELEVQLYKKLDNTPLEGGTVKLYELINGEKVLVDTLQLPDDYVFTFPLEKGKKYVIEGLKGGFFPETDTIDLTVPLPPGTRKIERKLSLSQELIARTFDRVDRTPLIGATVELLEITPDGLKSVGKLKMDSTHIFNFPIDMYKQYLIDASKPGYQGVRDTLRFTPEDVEQAGGRLIVDLELERVSFDDFLPLALYFDNDRPNPNTFRTNTDKEYMATNDEYYGKKEKFIEEFTAEMDPEQKFLTSRGFNNFFDREVRGGKQDLEGFSEKLLLYLQGGNAVTIKLQGYASPRAGTIYNKNLSARRVDCVRNYFERYKDGAFDVFLNSGKLEIEEEALGESTADLESISDRIDDPKNSIYSLIASVERRVEIVEVETEIKSTSSTNK